MGQSFWGKNSRTSLVFRVTSPERGCCKTKINLTFVLLDDKLFLKINLKHSHLQIVQSLLLLLATVERVWKKTLKIIIFEVVNWPNWQILAGSRNQNQLDAWLQRFTSISFFKKAGRRCIYGIYSNNRPSLINVPCTFYGENVSNCLWKAQFSFVCNSFVSRTSILALINCSFLGHFWNKYGVLSFSLLECFRLHGMFKSLQEQMKIRISALENTETWFIRNFRYNG